MTKSKNEPITPNFAQTPETAESAPPQHQQQHSGVVQEDIYSVPVKRKGIIGDPNFSNGSIKLSLKLSLKFYFIVFELHELTLTGSKLFPGKNNTIDFLILDIFET